LNTKPYPRLTVAQRPKDGLDSLRKITSLAPLAEGLQVTARVRERGFKCGSQGRFPVEVSMETSGN
jgi:hypothetical protein